jgi:soluble lytic murein transglycosylase-like protein
MTSRRKRTPLLVRQAKNPTRRKKGQNSRRKGSKWKYGLLGMVFFLILLILSFSVLHARVLEIRQKRGRQIASMVLEQTSLAQEKKERYAEAISRSAVNKGLNPAVVAGIVVVESSGNPLTVSGTGDLGLMQVNVKVHARDFDFQNHNLLNPEENIEVGTSILKTMLNRHGEAKAIAAYNGLLPEKQSYAGRVMSVLEKAGIPLDGQSVAYPAPVRERMADWWEAARGLV